MLKRSVAFLAMPVFALALASAAPAQEVPDEIPDGYLEGTWGIGGAEACGVDTTEHLTFDADGTFTAVQGGKPTAVGFWHLVEDVLDLHMVSSPAFFDDPTADFDDVLSDLAGQYQYFYAKALLFDIEPDGFRAVASMGNLLRGASYGRCR